MLEQSEKDLWRRVHRLESAMASVLRERGFYVQVINDLVAAGTRYQNAVNAKLGQDQATISQDEATIAQDNATISQLQANALTDDEKAQLATFVDKINTAAAALEPPAQDGASQSQVTTP